MGDEDDLTRIAHNEQTVGRIFFGEFYVGYARSQGLVAFASTLNCGLRTQVRVVSQGKRDAKVFEPSRLSNAAIVKSRVMHRASPLT